MPPSSRRKYVVIVNRLRSSAAFASYSRRSIVCEWQSTVGTSTISSSRRWRKLLIVVPLPSPLATGPTIARRRPLCQHVTLDGPLAPLAATVAAVIHPRQRQRRRRQPRMEPLRQPRQRRVAPRPRRRTPRSAAATPAAPPAPAPTAAAAPPATHSPRQSHPPHLAPTLTHRSNILGPSTTPTP